MKTHVRIVALFVALTLLLTGCGLLECWWGVKGAHKLSKREREIVLTVFNQRDLWMDYENIVSVEWNYYYGGTTWLVVDKQLSDDDDLYDGTYASWYSYDTLLFGVQFYLLESNGVLTCCDDPHNVIWSHARPSENPEDILNSFPLMRRGWVFSGRKQVPEKSNEKALLSALCEGYADLQEKMREPWGPLVYKKTDGTIVHIESGN